MNDVVKNIYKAHHAGATGFRRYGFTISKSERLQWFSPRIGSGKQILDVGCRDGSFTSGFSEGNTVTGVDIDDTALEIARERLGIETHSVNLIDGVLPFEAQAFDVVVAGEIMEHLPFPQHAVAEIYRVLKPGGLFLGSVPNAFRLWNRLLFLVGRDFENDPTHLRHFSPRSIHELLHDFASVDLAFLCSRHLSLSPRLMGTDMVWAATKA